MTAAEARHWVRWYGWLLRSISAASFAYLILCGLKGLYSVATPQALPRQLEGVASAIRAAGIWVYNLPLGATLWDNVTALSDMKGWLLSPVTWMFFTAMWTSGLLQRARRSLQAELRDVDNDLRRELWKGELRGQDPHQRANASPEHRQADLPRQPWESKWWAILLLAIVGGVVVSVAGQWLNLQLGLVR